jgi:hypothetical protein
MVSMLTWSIFDCKGRFEEGRRGQSLHIATWLSSSSAVIGLKLAYRRANSVARLDPNWVRVQSYVICNTMEHPITRSVMVVACSSLLAASATVGAAAAAFF